ncbi:Methylamine utilization protein MauG [uncultured Thiomicrorhabdus sp.]
MNSLMTHKKLTGSALFTALLSSILTGCGGGGETAVISLQEPVDYINIAELGSDLFVDTNLSNNRNQSCATCHAAGRAFTDPRHHSLGNGTVAVLARETGVSVGDDNFSIGIRNAPTAAYAALTPPFSQDENGYIGGQFWDGRASTLADQAGGPPLNSVEMQMPSKQAVIERLQENDSYVNAFKKFYGEGIFNDVDAVYLAMTQAIEAFEKTSEFQTFDSKWDRFLTGDYTFTASEQAGYELFQNKNCMLCHTSNADLASAKQTFTNYRYYNLGLPKNQVLIDENDERGLNTDFVENGDRGLLDNPAVTDQAEIGKFKTPTLRNVAVTAPYMHNASFKELRDALNFLNAGAADTETPFPSTVTAHMSAQNMSEQEVENLECFLRTLTDQSYEAVMPTTRTDGTTILCD